MTEQHKQLTYVLYEAINQVCNHYDITLDEFMIQNLSENKFIVWQTINNEIANKTDKEYQVTIKQPEMDIILLGLILLQQKTADPKGKLEIDNLIDHFTEIQQ